MSFISLSYLVFLPAVLTLYYLLPSKLKNPLLLLVSYGFYMCWGAGYALILLSSTLTTYLCGILISRRALGRRRLWLSLCLLANLSLVFVFKYYNFFMDAVSALAGPLGAGWGAGRLTLLLPVGISFYTFQALGYTMDVYRNDAAAETNFIDYALFVSFFPQLASGPIERCGAVLPQLRARRRFRPEDLAAGALLICWGFFKKMVIADRLAIPANAVYAAPGSRSAFQLAAGTVAFALQLYCDFSAYSDIARGSARALGISLTENFNAPYLAVSIRDFWRRWHISLSSWFRDYLYIPLGGSRVPALRRCVNLLIVFAVSGLWHGASVTYLLWGLLHGLYQAAGLVTAPGRKRLLRALRIPEESRPLLWLRRGITFFLVCFAWILFRASTLADAWTVVSRLASLASGEGGLVEQLLALGLTKKNWLAALLSLGLLSLYDCLGGERTLGGKICGSLFLRYAVLFVLIAGSVIFGMYGETVSPEAFVYFQF